MPAPIPEPFATTLRSLRLAGRLTLTIGLSLAVADVAADVYGTALVYSLAGATAALGLWWFSGKIWPELG